MRSGRKSWFRDIIQSSIPRSLWNTIDREVEGFSSVTSDNYSGGMKAARELFEAGSRYPLIVVSYIRHPFQNTGFPDFFMTDYFGGNYISGHKHAVNSGIFLHYP